MKNIYKTHHSKDFLLRWARWYDSQCGHMSYKVMVVTRRGHVYEGFIQTDKRKLKKLLRFLSYIN